MVRRNTRLLLTFLLLLYITYANPAHTGAAPDPTRPYAGTPSDLVNAVNALRASYGLPPYTANPILMAAAQGHADYMAVTGDVSHTGVGGSTVTQRLLSLGYPLAGDLSLGGFRSENITSGSEGMSAQQAVERWSGDTLHLTTMISPDLTEIGAGVTVHNGRVYYVIDCARATDSGLPQVVSTPMPGIAAPEGPTLPPGVSAIIIPVVVVTPNAAGDVIHEVKAGQTLWQIAISYETKIDDIKRLNNLFDNEIFPGMRLLVRKSVFLSPTVPVETPTLEASLVVTLPPTHQIDAQLPTLTAAPADAFTLSSSLDNMQIAVVLIALAVLGGGLVAWWGSRRK